MKQRRKRSDAKDYFNYNAAGEVEGVKYDRLSVVFVNAFKEQQTQIERQRTELEARTTNLRAENDALRRQLSALETRLAQLERRPQVHHRQTKGTRHARRH